MTDAIFNKNVEIKITSLEQGKSLVFSEHGKLISLQKTTKQIKNKFDQLISKQSDLLQVAKNENSIYPYADDAGDFYERNLHSENEKFDLLVLLKKEQLKTLTSEIKQQHLFLKNIKNKFLELFGKELLNSIQEQIQDNGKKKHEQFLNLSKIKKSQLKSTVSILEVLLSKTFENNLIFKKLNIEKHFLFEIDKISLSIDEGLPHKEYRKVIKSIARNKKDIILKIASDVLSKNKSNPVFLKNVKVTNAIKALEIEVNRLK